MTESPTPGPERCRACHREPRDDRLALEAARLRLPLAREIYGGINAVWDYGPLGVELKNNVKRAWWRAMVQERDDIVGLDAGILMHPKVWVTSGHVGVVQRPAGRVRGPDHRRYPPRRAARRREPDRHGPARTRPSSSGSGSSARTTAARCRRRGASTSCSRRTWARSRTTRRWSTSGPRPRRARTSTSRTSSSSSRKKMPFGIAQVGKIVPQRDQPRQLRLPDARVRADGDAVLRPARRPRPRHLRGVAAAPLGLVRRATA